MTDIEIIKKDIEDTFDSFGYPKEFLDCYDQIECLASANGKETFLVKSKTNNEFAIAKCFDKSTYSITVNIELLKSLDYKGIPKLIGCYENEKMLCVVREYIDGTALNEYVCQKELTKDEKLNICLKLADILIYLHSKDKPIIHRDIKPENVIIGENGEVYLIDYDIARTVKENNENDTMFFGTKGYAPPEQYGFEQTSQKADIYAFGVLMRFLYTGDAFSKKELSIEPRIKHIIDKCTAFSPKDRYSCMKLVKNELLGKTKFKIAIFVCILVIASAVLSLLCFNKATTKIEFKEPLVEKAVRLQLNVNENYVINEDDLAKVKELYIFGYNAYKYFDELNDLVPKNTSRGTLDNLDDIKYLPNLEKIVIGLQGELDISGLAYAKNLCFVDLKHTHILDLSPLSKLDNLNALFLFDTGINNCKALNEIPHLEHLDVGCTNINDIDSIGVFPNIKELSLKMLNMYDLEGIEKMSSLEVIWINGTSIADISSLTKLQNLKAIHTDQKYYHAISKLLEGRNVDIIIEEE